jgi:hypothetical protein
MATKAELQRAALLRERSLRNALAREKPRRLTATDPAKPHNLSARAGRNARVAYEVATGTPSRKSTRRSAHHQRAASQLERTTQLASGAPEVRAARSQARSVKVRGKSK